MRSDALGYVNDVCRQVIEIESQIERSHEKLGSKRFLRIDYEAFCLNPTQTVHAVASFVGDVRIREDRLRDDLRPFRPSIQSRLTAEETARMEYVLRNEYDIRTPGSRNERGDSG